MGIRFKCLDVVCPPLADVLCHSEKSGFAAPKIRKWKGGNDSADVDISVEDFEAWKHVLRRLAGGRLNGSVRSVCRKVLAFSRSEWRRLVKYTQQTFCYIVKPTGALEDLPPMPPWSLLCSLWQAAFGSDNTPIASHVPSATKEDNSAEIRKHSPAVRFLAMTTCIHALMVIRRIFRQYFDKSKSTTSPANNNERLNNSGLVHAVPPQERPKGEEAIVCSSICQACSKNIDEKCSCLFEEKRSLPDKGKIGILDIILPFVFSNPFLNFVVCLMDPRGSEQVGVAEEQRETSTPTLSGDEFCNLSSESTALKSKQDDAKLEEQHPRHEVLKNVVKPKHENCATESSFGCLDSALGKAWRLYGSDLLWYASYLISKSLIEFDTQHWELQIQTLNELIGDTETWCEENGEQNCKIEVQNRSSDVGLNTGELETTSEENKNANCISQPPELSLIVLTCVFKCATVLMRCPEFPSSSESQEHNSSHTACDSSDSSILEELADLFQLSKFISSHAVSNAQEGSDDNYLETMNPASTPNCTAAQNLKPFSVLQHFLSERNQTSLMQATNRHPSDEDFILLPPSPILEKCPKFNQLCGCVDRTEVAAFGDREPCTDSLITILLTIRNVLRLHLPEAWLAEPPPVLHDSLMSRLQAFVPRSPEGDASVSSGENGGSMTTLTLLSAVARQIIEAALLGNDSDANDKTENENNVLDHSASSPEAKGEGSSTLLKIVRHKLALWENGSVVNGKTEQANFCLTGICINKFDISKCHVRLKSMTNGQGNSAKHNDEIRREVLVPQRSEEGTDSAQTGSVGRYGKGFKVAELRRPTNGSEFSNGCEGKARPINEHNDRRQSQSLRFDANIAPPSISYKATTATSLNHKEDETLKVNGTISAVASGSILSGGGIQSRDILNKRETNGNHRHNDGDSYKSQNKPLLLPREMGHRRSISDDQRSAREKVNRFVVLSNNNNYPILEDVLRPTLFAMPQPEFAFSARSPQFPGSSHLVSENSDESVNTECSAMKVKEKFQQKNVIDLPNRHQELVIENVKLERQMNQVPANSNTEPTTAYTPDFFDVGSYDYRNADELSQSEAVESKVYRDRKTMQSPIDFAVYSSGVYARVSSADIEATADFLSATTSNFDHRPIYCSERSQDKSSRALDSCVSDASHAIGDFRKEQYTDYLPSDDGSLSQSDEESDLEMERPTALGGGDMPISGLPSANSVICQWRLNTDNLCIGLKHDWKAEIIPLARLMLQGSCIVEVEDISIEMYLTISEKGFAMKHLTANVKEIHLNLTCSSSLSQILMSFLASVFKETLKRQIENGLRYATMKAASSFLETWNTIFWQKLRNQLPSKVLREFFTFLDSSIPTEGIFI